MRLLVLGSNGLLGSNVVARARRSADCVVGTYHTTKPAFDVELVQLDIRDSAAVAALLDRHDIDAVVNCAAMTAVDECERDPERAREINAAAPQDLADCCAARDISFVHVSTDYVFDGTASRPYREDDDPAPIQEYGRSKLAGERNVVSRLESALVVRLSFVYGLHRGQEQPALDGFPAWVRSQLLSGESVPLFTDQRVTPSRAGAAASTLLDLLESGASGLYHLASRSCVTPYEFGTQIAEELGVRDSLVSSGSQADVDRPAARPTYSCLDVSKVEGLLGRPQPTLQADLSAIAEHL